MRREEVDMGDEIISTLVFSGVYPDGDTFGFFAPSIDAAAAYLDTLAANI